MKGACPEALTGTVASTTPASAKMTKPVGVTPGVWLTVAVKVTGWPRTDRPDGPIRVVVVGVGGSGGGEKETKRSLANSEVSPSESVAVAVTNWLMRLRLVLKVNEARPEASVVA